MSKAEQSAFMNTQGRYHVMFTDDDGKVQLHAVTDDLQEAEGLCGVLSDLYGCENWISDTLAA